MAQKMKKILSLVLAISLICSLMSVVAMAADEPIITDNGDGTSTIQIYQNLGDHNSTAAYYVVDRCTGEGQNVSDGTYLDLTNGTQDMDIFYADPESVLPEGIPCLILNETEFSAHGEIRRNGTIMRRT